MHIALNAHLLFGGASYRSAGIHQYIFHTLKHLPAAAPEFAFTVFTNGQPEMARAQIWPSRWPTHRPLARILWEQLAQPFHLARLRPNLLHSMAFASPLMSATPAVVTMYDLSFRLFPEKFPAFQRLYLSTLSAISCRRARRVLAISESTKRDVVRLLNVPAAQVDVAYPGVEARFRPLPQTEVEAFRARAGLPEQFILYLGTLEPRKNLSTLVSAFSHLQSLIPNLCLVLAGAKGWFYADLFKQVESLGLRGRVHFPGYVPAEELPLWYNAGAVFAYPSSFEGFGLPVLEALACGRPVVTSNTSSLPEAAGSAALKVPPQDVDALTEALHRALTAGEDLAARGPAHAAQFTWLATAQATVASYRRALEMADQTQVTTRL
ncbi:MAG: glycosyltransferase family 4 protein [Anaerolineales bacterium]|nr:glycosyltransferase family 4 protein [Anaerolineales bacterium]